MYVRRCPAGDGQNIRRAHGDGGSWNGHGGAPLPAHSGAGKHLPLGGGPCHLNLRLGDGHNICEWAMEIKTYGMGFGEHYYHMVVEKGL